MPLRIPTATDPDPSLDGPCLHREGCTCRRPYLGRAIVASVAMQLLMGIIAIASGATIVGLFACTAMAGCMAIAVVAEIVAFSRVGLGQPDKPDIGRNRGQPHRPNQMTW